MSLPHVTRDISDRPTRNSVTEPTNQERLHEDLDRKLRLYGVIEALRLGKLPDNIQIDETLQYMATHSPVDLDALSPAGTEIAKDIRDIIDTTRQIVKEKNADEIFQNFIWHTRGVDYTPAKADPSHAGLNANKAKNDSLEAAHHLRKLISLLITNTEARKLLSDFSLIGRDLLARSADLIRPDEEALRHADEPVSPDQPHFVASDGKTGIPRAEEEMVSQKMKKTKKGAGKCVDYAKESREKTAKPRSTPKQDGSFRDRLEGLRERVPSEYRDRVNAQFDRARHFFGDEYFPKERREGFIYRAKKIVVECQSNKSYQNSIKWFLDTIPQYSQASIHAAEESKGSWNEGEFKEAMDELKLMLTRFANDISPQGAIDSFKRILCLVHEDEGMHEWMGHVQDWMRRVLLEPGYVVDEQCNRDGIAIREEGRKFYDDKYKSYFDNFFDSCSTWFAALTTDPLNTRLGEDWARLTRHLLFDADGKLVWKPELWADIRRVIIPQLVDKVGYIPIPRAEFSDYSLDLVIENLTLSGRNMFPNIMSIEAHNFAKFSPYSEIHDENHHNIIITLGQIQADLRDVMFYFHKKTGVAKLRDSGLADILLGGNGITATVNLQSAARHTGSLFHVNAVHVKVDTLRFSIRDSKHDVLYKFLRPFATGAVKRQLQKALSDSIRTVFETADQLLVKVRDRMEEAQLTEGETKLGAVKQLFQEQVRSMNHKPSTEKKFNIVSTRKSLLLPTIGNPHAWIRKQEEEENIAKQGREWRSKAFTIVPTAAPTSHFDEPTAGSSRMADGFIAGSAADGMVPGTHTSKEPFLDGMADGAPSTPNQKAPVRGGCTNIPNGTKHMPGKGMDADRTISVHGGSSHVRA